MQSQKWPILQGFCSCAKLDQKMVWTKTMLITILDTTSKIMQITLYSKRWYTKEVTKTWKIWAKEKKEWGLTLPNREKLKKSSNIFYCLICEAKRE